MFHSSSHHSSYPPSLKRLIAELAKLPSIGQKTAARLAYHLVAKARVDSLSLADAIRDAFSKTKLCEKCFSLSENSLCNICSDNTRDFSLICVVEKPADVIAIEESRAYRGLYHVLHGLWSPLRGVNPDDLRLSDLINRTKLNGTAQVREVIIATSATVEGDATALYIANLLQEKQIRTSRLAQGLPKGGELEYADSLTLSHAFQGRREL